jgi:signal transduction histidine kinase/ActR/RegA family two-component response regulator
MEQRLLIYAPSGRDGPLAAKVLSVASIDSQVCRSAAELAHELERGAGVVLTVEEALSSGGFKVLGDVVARQAAWSDLPIILLTHRGNDSPAVRHAVATLGNVTLLERPVRTLTLLTSVQAALRARDKQYQVREAERRKDEFLASLGHELRNPLAPIQTSAALLGQLFPESPQVGKIRDVITRQVTHLTRLVDDLLDVARITSGKIALQRRDIPFSQVMQHVLELCGQAADAKRIDLKITMPERDQVLQADHARVVQILANVLSNAVKFTPFGGAIAVTARVTDGRIEVRVRDNGIGLESAEIPRIFAMFEQSKTVTGQLSSGLGIGLSLARRFAEMHGGGVEASSDGPGQGSTFIIRLPVIGVAGAQAAQEAQEAPAAREAAPPSSSVAGHGPRVLVVDDNRDAADSLSSLFALEGCDVVTAYDGYAALAAVEQRMPDLVVLDLGMPGMDGYEAARLIRQRPDGPNVLMIALTGWGQSDARRRTLDAGFDHHLIKPVDFTDLIRIARAEKKA